MSRRIDRVNVLLRQEISDILARQINDPRLSGVVSVTRVETSPDLSFARVHVSVLGDAAAKREALAGIESANAFVRRELRPRLALRLVPQLKFELDETIEKADRMMRVLDNIKAAPQPQPTPPDDSSGPLSINQGNA